MPARARGQRPDGFLGRYRPVAVVLGEGPQKRQLVEVGGVGGVSGQAGQQGQQRRIGAGGAAQGIVVEQCKADGREGSRGIGQRYGGGRLAGEPGQQQRVAAERRRRPAPVASTSSAASAHCCWLMR